MRAFGFEKEPVFKAMEATSIFGIDDALIGAVIGGVGSIAGGALGAKGSKNAAATAAAGNADALNAQREAYENSRGVLQPYVNRGNRAQSYLDAMLYGTGSFTDAPGYLSSPSQSLEAMLIKQNPGAWATWQGWEQKLKPSSYTKGHRAVYNDFKGFLQKTNPAAIEKAQGAMQQGAAQGATTVTRADALKNLESSVPWTLNEEDFTRREALNDADYLKAQGFTDDEIAAWTANAEAEQDKSLDAIFNRGGLTGQVGSTRRGVAQVGEEFARDRAQYEAGRRRADYDPYSKRRAGNYDTYASGRNSAYGSYLDALSGDADTGYNAATGQASAGQTYANNYGNLRSQGSKQQAGYLSDSADAWADAVGNAGAYITYGLSRKNNGKSSVTIPGGYDAYEPIGSAYRSYDDSGDYTAPRLRSSKQSSIYGAGLF